VGFDVNLHGFLAVKEFWKSVKNWQSYRHEFGGLLGASKCTKFVFWTQCTYPLHWGWYLQILVYKLERESKGLNGLVPVIWFVCCLSDTDNRRMGFDVYLLPFMFVMVVFELILLIFLL